VHAEHVTATNTNGHEAVTATATQSAENKQVPEVINKEVVPAASPVVEDEQPYWWTRVSFVCEFLSYLGRVNLLWVVGIQLRVGYDAGERR
jgi:hypothetical protein